LGLSIDGGVTAPDAHATAPATSAPCRTTLRLDLKRGHLNLIDDVVYFECINYYGRRLLFLLKMLLLIRILYFVMILLLIQILCFATFARFTHFANFALLPGKRVVGKDLLVDA
jgi:hypothetical protein